MSESSSSHDGIASKDENIGALAVLEPIRCSFSSFSDGEGHGSAIF